MKIRAIVGFALAALVGMCITSTNPCLACGHVLCIPCPGCPHDLRAPIGCSCQKLSNACVCLDSEEGYHAGNFGSCQSDYFSWITDPCGPAIESLTSVPCYFEEVCCRQLKEDTVCVSGSVIDCSVGDEYCDWRVVNESDRPLYLEYEDQSCPGCP